MWWLVVPVVVVAGKVIYDSLSDETDNDAKEEQIVNLPQRGHFTDKKVVVLGRTGAGKSSLINSFDPFKKVSVGDVSSTTRHIEGVLAHHKGSTINLIDTPGIGEAGTHNQYCSDILAWSFKNKHTIEYIFLTIQGDTKAHSEEHHLFNRLRDIGLEEKTVIVLTQADKVKPTRAVFHTDSWESERRFKSVKARHIKEKIDVIAEQFSLDSSKIQPVSITEEHCFNLRALKDLIF